MTSHEGKVCKTRAGTQSEAKYSYLFLAAIYLVRISQGLFLSILSPTLLFLADNVDSEVASVSPMFTGKSLGFMFGSFAVGYSLRHHRPMLTLGIADFLCGAFMFFIPLVKSIWWLYALVTLCGLVYGYIDAAGQGLLLNIWGEERSRSLIQGYHFAFTIGAFIAPMIAKPFLEMASFIKDADAKCPKTVSFSSHLESTTSRSNTSTEEFQYNSTLTSVSIDTGLNPTVYVYFLFGTFAVIVSIFLFVLAALNATKKLKQL
ncbi:sodium-dependent glucose transporter 1-like [Clavelina lepadiformis]|uniref:sodium-dependent glucose transporter 1-like n=1 Tax=Clavelina lepadiformis TaxID=159417 RepID=UPI004042456E